MVMLPKKIIFRRIFRESEQLKSLNLKMQEGTSKKFAMTEKKKKAICQTNHTTNQGPLTSKFTTVIDYTDEPVIQFDISVVSNAFVNDCKINDKNEN